MVFSSISFLFLFLPLVITGYFLLPWRLKNGFLLIMSLLFYLWGSGALVYLMLVSISGNYLFGLALAASKRQRIKDLWLAGAVTFNLALLFYFKYFNFFIDTSNALFSLAGLPSFAVAKVVLPIGISFFTFQAMSYVIDLYRGEVEAQKNLPNFALYITFFPQLIAGPIVRYIDVAAQIDNRSHSFETFAAGARRFILGLAKKVIIANGLAEIADRVFALEAGTFSPAVAWLGVLAYAFQIYFDFSAYSDMAIGLGRMFGFTFLENFNYPYISRSITEFWKRWHISLSTWFRDYLYIPLGGNRVSPARTYINLYIVFLLCGFWHGADWPFLAWGLYQGTLLVLERAFWNRALLRLPVLLQFGYSTVAILVGWVLFRAANLEEAGSYLSTMFGLVTNQGEYVLEAKVMLNREAVVLFISAAICSTPIYPWLNKQWQLFKECSDENRIKGYAFGACHASLSLCFYLILLSYSAMRLASSGYNPFIYFRF